MNGREALKALADGKRVRAEVARSASGERAYLYAPAHTVEQILARDDWELIEDPATDEELIAEMERLSRYVEANFEASTAYKVCARMLRERKVAP